MSKYYVLKASEDGFFVYEVEKARLEKELLEEYSGFDHDHIVDCFPHHDPNYWGNSMVIIKGEIVTPQIVTAVTKLELD